MNRLGLLALVLVAAFSEGCGSAPVTRHYTLHLAPAKAAALPAKHKVRASVGDFDIAEAYRSDRIAYRPSPYEVGYYNYDRWASAPEEQVREAVLARAVESGLFLEVGEGPALGRPDVVIEGRIDRIEEEDATPSGGAGTARLAIELRLVEESDRKPLVVRRYDRGRLLGDGAGEERVALVRALSEALDEVLRDFLAEADRALARRPSTRDRP